MDNFNKSIESIKDFYTDYLNRDQEIIDFKLRIELLEQQIIDLQSKFDNLASSPPPSETGTSETEIKEEPLGDDEYNSGGEQPPPDMPVSSDSDIEEEPEEELEEEEPEEEEELEPEEEEEPEELEEPEEEEEEEEPEPEELEEEEEEPEEEPEEEELEEEEEEEEEELDGEEYIHKGKSYWLVKDEDNFLFNFIGDDEIEEMPCGQFFDNKPEFF